MAILRIWNILGEIVLEDHSETIESVEDLLDAYNEENNLCSSGGLAYDFKISIYDDLLMRTDELENEAGDIVGRYEMKVY